MALYEYGDKRQDSGTPRPSGAKAGRTGRPAVARHHGVRRFPGEVPGRPGRTRIVLQQRTHDPGALAQ